MERKRNADNLPFWDAIQNEPQRCREALPYQHRVYSYIDRGFYADQLRRVRSYFPREQMLILRNEELRNNLQNTLDSICKFLRITFFRDIEPKDVHSGSYVSSLTFREKTYLMNIFLYGIKDLERMLNWDCSDWLK